MLRRLFIAIIILPSILMMNCTAERTNIAQEEKTEGMINIVVSFLPLEVFTANVIGDREGVTLQRLLPANGVDTHNYRLTARDIDKLHKADILVMNGMGFEPWGNEIPGELSEGTIVVTASDGVTPLFYEGGRRDENTAPNPHCWVSPKRAVRMVENIRDGLTRADPDGREFYLSNADSYIARLKSLDAEIEKAIAGAPARKIATFHRAFDYFALDYGLEVAAVIEAQPGQKPSAGEMARLAKTLREEDIKTIFIEPQYPTDVAETIADETGSMVSILDPFATGEFSLDGYEKAWRSNLENLLEALQ